MTRAMIAEARVFASWQNFQEALLRAIESLTDPQLYQPIVPGQRTPGDIVKHIVYGRAFWLHQALGARAATVEPLLQWDDPDDPPRTATELAQGLTATWQLLAAALLQGAASDEIVGAEIVGLQILWGLIDHDLPHGGELSLLLGVAGLPGVEL